jgi:hypothetical protein
MEIIGQEIVRNFVKVLKDQSRYQSSAELENTARNLTSYLNTEFSKGYELTADEIRNVRMFCLVLPDILLVKTLKGISSTRLSWQLLGDNDDITSMLCIRFCNIYKELPRNEPLPTFQT